MGEPREDTTRLMELEANDRLLAHVRKRLAAEGLTGQLILHTNHGIIRKIETRDFETAEDILSGQ